MKYSNTRGHMPPDRQMISDWWCSHHWQSYEHDKSAGKRASHAMAEALTAKPDFARSVEQRQAKYKVSVSRAARAVIEDWVGRTDKPVCCLLGDKAMADIHTHVYSNTRASA